MRVLRSSRSVASMLPALLLTGVVTLVATAVERQLAVGFSRDFVGGWLESWLVAWPITFPIAYLLGPALARLADRTAMPIDSPAARRAGANQVSKADAG